MRQGVSFSELSISSLSSLHPYSDYVGVNISLNNFSSLSFLNVYAPSIRSSPTDGKIDSFSFSILPSSRNIFILGDFNCHHSFWNSKGTPDPRGEKIFNWVISSDLLPLNDPDIPTLIHRSSPDISFAPSSLALSCSWEVLQDRGSDHLPILLTVPFSPVFRPNKRPHPSIFRKLAGMTLSSALTLTVLLQRNTLSFSFLCCCSLYRSDTKCGQIFHPFGRIKCYSKAWWSAEVEKTVSERRKALLPLKVMKIARLTSLLPDVPRLSSSRPRLRHGRRLALLSRPNLTLICVLSSLFCH